MSTDIEQLLAQELRQVADDVQVPAMPPVTDAVPRPSHRWIPLLVAAVIATIVAGAMLLVPEGRGKRETPPVETPRGLSTQQPTIPYVEGDVLADGRNRLQGAWHSLSARGDSWVAVNKESGSDDNRVSAWYWDYLPGEPEELSGAEQAVLSANGKYVAAITRLDPGHARVTVFGTGNRGDSLGFRDFASGGVDDENHLTIVAVTDTGQVIVHSVMQTAQLWDPESRRLIDLSRTAPEQIASSNSDAGPVFTDGLGGPAYVADVDAEGRVTRKVGLPNGHVLPNHAGTYGLAEGAFRIQGDLATFASVTLHELGRDGKTSLAAPRGWRFVRFQWETDDLFLGAVIDADGTQRTARCSVEVKRCLLLPRLGTFAEDKLGNDKADTVSSARPSMVYVEDGVLRDDDVVVPGRWKFVIARGDTWAAQREDGTWWWDLQPGEPAELKGLDGEPVVSANGKYLATARLVDGNVEVFVFTTRSGGEGIRTRRWPSGGGDDENHLILTGVTDSGLVILRSLAQTLLWEPFQDKVLDLTEMDSVPVRRSPAGIVWHEERGDRSYVGDVDAQGRLTSGTGLPDAQVVPNPDATSGLSESGLGSVGTLTTVELIVHDLVKAGSHAVQAPEGWQFIGGSLQWEDARHFIVGVVGDGDEQRTARCSVTENRCVLVDPAR